MNCVNWDGGPVFLKKSASWTRFSSQDRRLRKCCNVSPDTSGYAANRISTTQQVANKLRTAWTLSTGHFLWIFFLWLRFSNRQNTNKVKLVIKKTQVCCCTFCLKKAGEHWCATLQSVVIRMEFRGKALLWTNCVSFFKNELQLAMVCPQERGYRSLFFYPCWGTYSQ